jgi:hypothetical protein
MALCRAEKLTYTHYYCYSGKKPMVQENSLITMQIDWEAALERAISSLEKAGLQAMRSFDLSLARSVHTHCTCPHHGTEQCDCMLVVFLIYNQGRPPLSLVVHGYDGKVNFTLVVPQEGDPDQRTEMLIRRALAPQNFSGLAQGRWARAA